MCTQTLRTHQSCLVYRLSNFFKGSVRQSSKRGEGGAGDIEAGNSSQPMPMGPMKGNDQ